MLAAAYAVRLDQAIENDRLVALGGGEIHFVQDFLDETDYRVLEEDDSPAATIIQLSAFLESRWAGSVEKG